MSPGFTSTSPALRRPHGSYHQRCAHRSDAATTLLCGLRPAPRSIGREQRRHHFALRHMAHDVFQAASGGNISPATTTKTTTTTKATTKRLCQNRQKPASPRVFGRALLCEVLGPFHFIQAPCYHTIQSLTHTAKHPSHTWPQRLKSSHLEFWRCLAL